MLDEILVSCVLHLNEFQKMSQRAAVKPQSSRNRIAIHIKALEFNEPCLSSKNVVLFSYVLHINLSVMYLRSKIFLNLYSVVYSPSMLITVMISITFPGIDIRQGSSGFMVHESLVHRLREDFWEP